MDPRRETGGQCATKFTLPDGGRASAVHVMTRDNDDSFRWKSVSRVIDGSLQPDIDEVTFIRRTNESSASVPDADQDGNFEPDQGRDIAVKTSAKIAVLIGSALLVSFASHSSLAQRPGAADRAVGGSCPAGAAKNVNRSPSMSRPGRSRGRTGEPPSQRQPAGWSPATQCRSKRRHPASERGSAGRSSTAKRGKRWRGYSASERRSAGWSPASERGKPGRGPSASECRSTGWSPASEARETMARAFGVRPPVNRAACSGPTPAIKRLLQMTLSTSFSEREERTTPRPIGYPPGWNDRGQLRARPQPNRIRTPATGSRRRRDEPDRGHPSWSKQCRVGAGTDANVNIKGGGNTTSNVNNVRVGGGNTTNVNVGNVNAAIVSITPITARRGSPSVKLGERRSHGSRPPI